MSVAATINIYNRVMLDSHNSSKDGSQLMFVQKFLPQKTIKSYPISKLNWKAISDIYVVQKMFNIFMN
jgi:hypothetical protein